MLWVKFYVLAICLCFLAIIPQASFAQDAEAQADMQKNESEKTYKVYYVSAKQIKNYLDQTKGQRRAVYLFSASCEECIRRMPHLMEIEAERDGSIIPINVDTDYKILKRYLIYYKHMPFDIIVNKGAPYDLVNQMKPYGVRAWSTLPRVWLLDEENNLIGQGGHSPDKIKMFLGIENRE